MKESEFQHRLMETIRELLPGCIVFKTDPCFMQGFPDLIILYKERWAALECKRSIDAPHRPNQDLWVDTLGAMSFASFIYPENRKEVLYELQRSLES